MTDQNCNNVLTTQQLTQLYSNNLVNEKILMQEDIMIRKEIYKLQQQAQSLKDRYTLLQRDRKSEQNRLILIFNFVKSMYDEKALEYLQLTSNKGKNMKTNEDLDRCQFLQKWLAKAQDLYVALDISIKEIQKELESCSRINLDFDIDYDSNSDSDSNSDTSTEGGSSSDEEKEKQKQKQISCCKLKKKKNSCNNCPKSLTTTNIDTNNCYSVINEIQKMARCKTYGRLNEYGVLERLSQLLKSQKSSFVTLCESDYQICVCGKMINLKDIDPCVLYEFQCMQCSD